MTTWATPAHAQDDDDRRVLVFSVPGLTWEDVDEADIPNLRALLDESAVANTSLRVQRLATQPGEGYASLSAGPAPSPTASLAGLSFGNNELFGDGTAGEEASRQIGRPVDERRRQPLVAAAAIAERRSEFEADLGLLGDALADAGVERGVVANADGDDLLIEEPDLRREAAIALADGDGVVPCGNVTVDLLVNDRVGPVREAPRRGPRPRGLPPLLDPGLGRAGRGVGSPSGRRVRRAAERRAGRGRP